MHLRSSSFFVALIGLFLKFLNLKQRLSVISTYEQGSRVQAFSWLVCPAPRCCWLWLCYWLCLRSCSLGSYFCLTAKTCSALFTLLLKTELVLTILRFWCFLVRSIQIIKRPESVLTSKKPARIRGGGGGGGGGGYMPLKKTRDGVVISTLASVILYNISNSHTFRMFYHLHKKKKNSSG